MTGRSSVTKSATNGYDRQIAPMHYIILTTAELLGTHHRKPWRRVEGYEHGYPEYSHHGEMVWDAPLRCGHQGCTVKKNQFTSR